MLVEVDWAEAIARKYPEHVVFVISCDSSGRPNIMPAGWCMIASGKPPMLATAISQANYTHELIRETGEFVIAFPNEKMGELIRQTGSCSGRDVDKFSKFKIETVKSKHVRPPLLQDAVACFECILKGELTTGDHTIFAGEVLASYISDRYKHRLYNFGDRKFRIIPTE